METKKLRLKNLNTWNALQKHKDALEPIHLKQLFSKEPERFKNYSLIFQDILFDFSKQKVNRETIKLLIRLANDLNLDERIQSLFEGGHVNFSENLPALHMKLRDLSANKDKAVVNTLQKMELVVENLRSGKYYGANNQQITDILCLGIGGSFIGPQMICQALKPYRSTNIKIHFVANADGETLENTLNKLTPAKTLCVITSKSFSTPETMMNAAAVKEWLKGKLNTKANFQKQIIAITASKQDAIKFGIYPENILEIWEWVGGRYSIWSSVGFVLALSIGMSGFREFLQGAFEVDNHFTKEPFQKNIPVLMGLLGIWNINLLGYNNHAIIPYADVLKDLPSYLQQLEMESNGKTTTFDAQTVDYKTSPIIVGDIGCNIQHSYMQLLHQGTHIIPVDFILPTSNHSKYKEHQEFLVSSCLSQSKALMEGSADDGKPEDKIIKKSKISIGNRPSSTFMFPKLTPRVLGSLLALYEHKVFVQGVIWGINSFDQYGVELGKKLSEGILHDLRTSSHTKQNLHDSSTLGLLSFFHKHKQ